MNSDGKKCKTKYCRNQAANSYNYCHKCRSRKLKQTNPTAYYFNALRNNARRRGKQFEITLEQFREFCTSQEFNPGSGRKKSSLTIDRIDARKGYCIDNIQILTLSENSRKGNEEKYPF